jgi:hypothetical protein
MKRRTKWARSRREINLIATRSELHLSHAARSGRAVPRRLGLQHFTWRTTSDVEGSQAQISGDVAGEADC